MCDDDPALAVPVAVGASAAPAGRSAGADAVARELADQAVAARQVTSLDGRPPEPTVPDATPALPQRPAGRLRDTLTGLREGRRKVDLQIHDDALVIGRDGSGGVIPLDQLVALTVERTPRGGAIRIAAGGTPARRLRFRGGHELFAGVAGRVQAIDPRRFAMVPLSGRRRLVHRAVVSLVVLVVAAAVALVARSVAFPPARAGDDLPAAARSALRGSCPAWRAAPVGGAELARVATELRPALARAAEAAPAFASLPADLDIVTSFAPLVGRPDAPLVEASAFSAAVERIDAACAGAGA